MEEKCVDTVNLLPGQLGAGEVLCRRTATWLRITPITPGGVPICQWHKGASVRRQKRAWPNLQDITFRRIGR